MWNLDSTVGYYLSAVRNGSITFTCCILYSYLKETLFKEQCVYNNMRDI